MADFLDTQTDEQVNADVSLAVTLTEDSEVTFMGLSRASSNNIGIEFSVTVEGVTVKLIDIAAGEANSDAQDFAITDVFALPTGSIVRVVTSGIVSGAADAVIVLDSTFTGRN